MVKRNRAILIFTILVSLLASSGCVYYNTFFLARKHYRYAEKIRQRSEEETVPSEAITSYNIVIEKSSKVLVFYPTSRWADNALFLMGMSLLWTDEPVQAATTFEELLGEFPDSRFASQARYWRSIAWMRAGEFDKAESEFIVLAEESDEFGEDAAFMIAESYYIQNDFVTAELEFEKFIEEHPKSSLVSLAALRLMDISFRYERYERVIELEKYISARDLNDLQFFTAQLRVGEAYIELNRLDKALKHFAKMKRVRAFSGRLGDIEVRIGRIFYEQGDTAMAADTWRTVTRRYAYSEASAWAFYYLGMMYLEVGDIELALDYFDKSHREGRGHEIGRLAFERAEALRGIMALRQKLTDTTATDIDPAQIRMDLAEMYVLQLNQPDSAISQYRLLLKELGDHELAPKAMYSLGWTYASAKRDWETADSVYGSLLKEFGETDYAVGAVSYFVGRGAALDSTEVQTVGYKFIHAEELLLTHRNPRRALAAYKEIVRDYPNSRFRPKSMMAIAYINAEYLDDADAAKETYATVAENYPGTKYDSLAQIRLGFRDIVIEPERPAELDSVFAELERRDLEERERPGELTQREIDSLTAGELPVLRLYPLETLELDYPESEWSTSMRGKITRLKIFVDAFCKVDRAEIIGSSGNRVIDEAIRQAMLKAEFDPERIDVTRRNEWYLYEVRVRPPIEAEYRRY